MNISDFLKLGPDLADVRILNGKLGFGINVPHKNSIKMHVKYVLHEKIPKNESRI